MFANLTVDGRMLASKVDVTSGLARKVMYIKLNSD
ncbi:hypothetical protein POHY109586_01430 [Polaromonas hydrogenivorans]